MNARLHNCFRCDINLLLTDCNFIVFIQNQRDSRVRVPEESRQVENGFCRTNPVQDVKINGLKMNGHSMSTKGNGLITNGHVKNGQCLLVNGNGHLAMNGYKKSGQWKLIEDGTRKNGVKEDGYCGVVKRHRNNGHTCKEGSMFTEETSSVEDEHCSEDTSETAQSGHIKVSFNTLLDIQ